jgi:SagB-type dehydrogenase family enzyme
MASPPGDALRDYHERTKHSFESVHRQPHYLDWEIMPRPFKVYPDLEALPLSRDFTTSTRPVFGALADTGTASADGAPLDRAALARLLFFSAGVLRHKKYPAGEIFFRAAACTGALYHIDVYVVCGALPDLDAGVYHFGPHDFALRRLRAGDHREVVVRAAGHEPAIASAPVILVTTSTFWRNAWKYRARAYRHAWWDDGTLLANLLALAAAARLPARVVLGFGDDDLNRLLDLDTAREVTLGLVALGSGSAPTPAPPVEPLGLATLPPSVREIEYPEIGRAHAASSQPGADVAAWRGTIASRPAAATGPLIPLAPSESVEEPVESVIVRRGSTREFAHEAISFPDLSTILRSATRGIPADFTAPGSPLTDVYAIVHAVDGLEPGTYTFDRTHDALTLLRPGSFRREAGHLGLDQRLPADAAVDLYWLADLDAVFARFGERGYRAAQLEAAIEGGKTYLAAYALRLGATGLTFYDDQVTAFFSPHAAGKSVMFLMACGRSAPRRR